MTETPIPWRVIRAAPDMLKVLEDVYQFLDVTGPQTHETELAKRVAAAIAKANGEFKPEERKENAAN
jgi:tellurite resistance protein